MLKTANFCEDGKVFKEIEYQIMLRKDKIRTYKKSIEKTHKLAGTNGPKGLSSIDYSRVITSTRMAHIGLDDAIRMIERDEARILELEYEIKELRYRKRNLLLILQSLEGLEAQIYYHRFIMDESQGNAADKIGVSVRHLQRIEKQMKDTYQVNNVR